MNSSLTAQLSVSEIIKEIKNKRKAFDKQHPLVGRRWYTATGMSIEKFNEQYRDNTYYEFHILIESKSVLDEVLTKVMQDDKIALAEIEHFLFNKTTPVYIFNYCFNFN